MSGALNSNLVSCNFPSPSVPTTPTQNPIRCSSRYLLPLRKPTPPLFLRVHRSLFPMSRRRRNLLLLVGAGGSSGDPVVEEQQGHEEEGPAPASVQRTGTVDEGGSISDWTTSILLFGFYIAVMYYAFQLSPNQTPSRDMYFVQKLMNIKGNDGFHMNDVLVALWYIMGLWPILYSMLLLPSGRSSRGKIPVWPFLVASFFFGAYALIPYFILWKPPPSPVEEEEIGRWPLYFLESKISAGILFATGFGLIIYAGLAGGDQWTEFYQYFRESKLVHATSLDFSLLSAFSAFWMYNDMSARRWIDRGSWLLYVALFPFLGPALYLLMRPSLSSLPSSPSSKAEDS